MNQTRWSTQNRYRFETFVTDAMTHHAEVFDRMWWPYILGFHAHVERGLFRVGGIGGLEDLEKQLKTLPAGMTYRLKMNNQYMVSHKAIELFEDPLFRHVSAFDIGANEIGCEGFEALCKAPALANLSHLSVSGNFIMDKGMRVLSEAQFPVLKTLSLRANLFDNDGLTSLAHANGLPMLTQLNLGYNRFDARLIVETLIEDFNGPLDSLILDHSKFTDEHVSLLAQSPRLAELRSLDLRFNLITNEGACALSQSPYIGGLNTLKLEYNTIERAGALDLARSPYLSAPLREEFERMVEKFEV